MPKNTRSLLVAHGDEGFTLIETLVAIVVLTIGIFALYAMQTTSIRYNASAYAMTTAATWAGDNIERLMSCDYDDPLLQDDNNPVTAAVLCSGPLFSPPAPADGIAGLSATGATADGLIVSPDQRYTIIWNVADIIKPNPSDANASTVKALRVIVRHSDHSINKEVTMNYFKKKTF